MTYFPSSDPDKLCSAMTQHGSFGPTPPDSAELQPRDQWTGTGSAVDQGAPSSGDLSWPAHDQHGLGLGSFFAGTNVAYSDGCQVSQSTLPTSMAFSWPSESQPSMTDLYHAAIRKDSWNDTCDPVSTVAPSDPWYQPAPNMPFITYEASPSLSDWSTSSRRTTMSSPYAFSDACGRTASSPLIKVEESVERMAPRIHFISETTPLEQSLLVNPDDLMRQSSQALSIDNRPTDFAIDPFRVLMGEDIEDVKPALVHRRPSSYRSLSCESSRADEGEDRRRHKRSFTKPETASCSCERCGKLFQRSYNLKAHMETHDPHRKQPHICPHPACEKRFVRRTDLVRHEQSVHLKIRDYICPMCDNSFARKDTLRRHVDDGCAKRPEVKRRVTKIRKSSTFPSEGKNEFGHDYEMSAALSPRKSSTFPIADKTPPGQDYDLFAAPSPLRQHVQYG